MTPSAWSPSVRPVRVLLGAVLAVLVLLGGTPHEAEAAAPKPTKVVATATGDTSVAVTWKAVAKASAYTVKYSTKSSMTKSSYATSTQTSVSLTGLKVGATYYLKVKALKASGKALSGYSSKVKVTTTTTTTGTAGPPSGGGSGGSSGGSSGNGSTQLRVASYNITCAACYDGQPNELPWTGRRDTLVAAIKAQDLDVIGIQEAGQGWLKDADGNKIDLSQFEDLRNRLGGTWTLTNDKRNNCARSKSPNDCDYVDQGASDGTRILFDSSRVRMLDSGSKLLPKVSGMNDRYVAWARLQQLSTGKQFMYASAHLEHSKDTDGSLTLFEKKREQAEVVAQTVAAHNPNHLPSFIVGDMNSSRFPHDYSPSNAPYDVYTKAGYTDPLGGAWRTTRTAPGALVKNRIHTWVNSFNGFGRTVTRKDGWVNGSYIDYIMVSSGIQVPEWETVVKLGSDGNLEGIIPSDHNMIRATVVLPS